MNAQRCSAPALRLPFFRDGSRRARFSRGVVAAVALLGSACTHSVHQVAMSNFGELRQGRLVHAQAEQFVVLSLATGTDFADEAYARLLQQCPEGILRGIQARHSTSHGFLSYTNRLHMRAYCVPAENEAVR